MVTSYERETTWRTQVVFQSGSTNIDPSSNMAYLDVIDSEGTTIISSVSGTRTDTGTYHYYISTQSTDPLGLYLVEWRGLFNYGGRWNYSPKYDKSVVNIVKVKQ